MDPILDAAEKKRDELRQELRKIEDFLATYRTLALSLKLDTVNTTETSTDRVAVVDRLKAEADREAKAADAPPPKRVRVTDNPKPSVVVEAAVDLIRATGRPMTRKEIREGLIETGIVVNGADPVKALGTMLWRSGSDQLVQIEGRGYWLKELPVPKVGERMSLEAQSLF